MRSTGRICFAVAISVLLLASSLSSPFGGTARARQQQQRPAAEPLVARVSLPTQAELERFVRLGHDLLETREGDDLFILASSADIERLRGQGWRVGVDEKKTALLRAQRPELRQSRTVTQAGAAESGTAALGVASYGGGYLTVPEMRAFLDAKAQQYPNLAEVFVYGKSWERATQQPSGGHDLFGIKLTNQQRTGPKPVFFLMAAIHARELSTSELALRFVDHLLKGYGVDADATWLLDEHTVVVVPTTNPDARRLAEQGHMHRKNTNPTNNIPTDPCSADAFSHDGIDLNRNHDFKWGEVNAPTTNPCDQTYPGPTVASEPETQALQELVRSLIPDRRGPLDTDAAQPNTQGILITIHSYANLVMWPWGHTSNPAPDAAGLSLIGGKFAGYNGYTPQQANQLYPSSGKTDEWAYGELGIPAYVFEVGVGEGECGGFMPPYRCLDEGLEGFFWQRNLPTFLYSARIAGAPYQLAQGPTTESAAALPTATAGVVELRAHLDERRNGGQAIAAAEYYVDTPPWAGGVPVPMAAADGSFDGTVEVATATIGPLAGTHTIYVRAQDAAGNWGPVRAVYSTDETCAYAIGSASRPVDATGGYGVFDVTAGRGCGWATSVRGGAGWLDIPSGGLGAGSSTVLYKAAPNTGANPRTATLTVGGQTITVTQSGVQVSSVSLNPTNVWAGRASTGTVTLTAPAPAGGAVVALSTSNTAAATAPASVTVAAGATSQTFTVTTQPVAVSTLVIVSAAYGGATRTAELTVTPPVNPPSDLRATAYSSKIIDLVWADGSANEAGFRIERCEGLTCTNFVEIATVRSNTTTYRSSGLLSRRTYRYRVRAYNANGNSAYSNIASATTK